MKKHLFFAFIAVILYYSAPFGVNIPICVFCFIVYLYITYDLLRKDFKERHYITFNSLFLFSFFLTSFCFPVFILTSEKLLNKFTDLSMLVFQFINFDYITRGVILCMLAISVYAAFYKRLSNKRKTSDESIMHTKFKIGGLNILLIMSLLACMANAFYSYRTYNVTNLSQNAFFYDILKASLVVSFVARVPILNSEPNIKNTFKTFFVSNRVPIIVTALSCLLFLYFGVRNLAISVVLIALAAMTIYYTLLSLKYIIVLVVLGVCVLFVIRETRHSDNSIMNADLSTAVSSANLDKVPIILYFSDLIGACQELCLGVEIKDTQGLQSPEQVVLIPFLPFPVLPSIVSNLLWGKSYQEATESFLLNNYMNTQYGKHSTFGKHCVSDLYVKWGILGIIVVFSLFGYVVAKADKNKRESYYEAAAYMTLFSLAIFTPRGSLIDVIRPLSYVIFLVYCFQYKKRKV